MTYKFDITYHDPSDKPSKNLHTVKLIVVFGLVASCSENDFHDHCHGRCQDHGPWRAPWFDVLSWWTLPISHKHQHDAWGGPQPVNGLVIESPICTASLLVGASVPKASPSNEKIVPRVFLSWFSLISSALASARTVVEIISSISLASPKARIALIRPRSMRAQ